MASLLIISSVLAGILPVGVISAFNNSKIMKDIVSKDILPKRKEQLDYISSTFDNSSGKKKDEIIDTLIQLSKNVINNNSSLEIKNMNYELIKELYTIFNKTIENYRNPEKNEILEELNEQITELKANYETYVDNIIIKRELLEDSNDSIFDFTNTLINLPFHILIQRNANSGDYKIPLTCNLGFSIPKGDDSTDESILFEMILDSYTTNSTDTILEILDSSLRQINTEEDLAVRKLKEIKKKIVEKEKTYRDDLISQAKILYQYSFDLDEKVQKNTSITSFLKNLYAIIQVDENIATLGELYDINKTTDTYINTSKTFKNFVLFVKDDVDKAELFKKQQEELFNLKEKERIKRKSKKKKQYDEDELLLLLLLDEEYISV